MADEAIIPGAAPAAPDSGSVPVTPAFTPHTATPSLLEQTTFAPEATPAPTAAAVTEAPITSTPPATPEPSATPAPDASTTPAPTETPAPTVSAAPEATVVPTAAPVVTYAPFDFGEGVKVSEAETKLYTDTLAKHGITQEAGQELVALHSQVMKQYADSMLQDQHRAFGETRAKWAQQIAEDPVMGGAGAQTVAKAVARARNLFVPTEDMPAFNEFLKVTGAGDHPAFWRMLHRASRLVAAPAAVPAAKPPADNGKPKGGKGSLYNNTTFSK